MKCGREGGTENVLGCECMYISGVISSMGVSDQISLVIIITK